MHSSESALRHHITDLHEWEPRPCRVCGPENGGLLYQTRYEYSNHVKDVLDRFDPPIHCPLRDEGCNAKERVYDRRDGLLYHLVHPNSHNLDAGEARKMAPMPRPKIAKAKVTWECPIEECTFPFRATNFGDLRTHLKTYHSLTDDQALEMVPISKQESNRARKREREGSNRNWQCPVDGCKSETKSLVRTPKRRDHLIKKHEWSYERTLAHVAIGPSDGRKKPRTTEVGAPTVPRALDGWLFGKRVHQGEQNFRKSKCEGTFAKGPRPDA